MAMFDPAIEEVLQNEGGYVNDPKDAGGETNFGISKRSFPNVDIKSLTRQDAKNIYHQHFWAKNPHLARLTSQAVATKTFDLMVNMGARPGVKILQQSINQVSGNLKPVPVDGKLGPLTVSRANELDETALLQAIRDNAARRYCAIVQRKPGQQKFLRGWLLRAYDRPRSRTEPTPKCPDDHN